MKWLLVLAVILSALSCTREPEERQTQQREPKAEKQVAEDAQSAERLEAAQPEPEVQEKAVQENPIVWKESPNSLAIGIRHAGELTLEVYFENRGSAEIAGLIRSQARFIIELNGKFYAMADRGGKSSWMPPGRSYGPLRIDMGRFWEIPKLTRWYSVEPNDAHPVLKAGRNSLRLHYKLDNELIPSAEIIVDR